MTTNERTRLFYDPNSLSNFNRYRIIHTYFNLNVDFNSNILDGYVQFDIKSLDNKFCDCSSSIITENKEIPNNHGNKLVLDSDHLNIKNIFIRISNNMLVKYRLFLHIPSKVYDYYYQQIQLVEKNMKQTYVH